MANHKIDFALSLSDPNVVNIFKDRFLEVLKIKQAKYLFCNKDEAIALTGENFKNELPKYAQNFVVTDGANESFIFEDGKSSNLKAYKVDAIDSNGAGDIFAGGCLHAIISGADFHESCNFGNYASSQIVQERSPRLTQDGYIKLKENYLEL